jgi:hypothetical protein
MFQLAAEESGALRSRIGALETGRGKHRKYAPYVFTEQGVAMRSSVLNSQRAVRVNIEIMRALVRLRETVSTHKDHTWHPSSRQTACFEGSEAPPVWVRFPSPAPLSAIAGNARQLDLQLTSGGTLVDVG